MPNQASGEILQTIDSTASRKREIGSRLREMLRKKDRDVSRLHRDEFIMVGQIARDKAPLFKIQDVRRGSNEVDKDRAKIAELRWLKQSVGRSIKWMKRCAAKAEFGESWQQREAIREAREA